ncbi:MAG: 2-oxo acid dehydrogenase subunit E2 [Chloroflexi bacterium]|nr:2-oxo acid dehydrogenase subunit E2 [Chloroflexota bacterium]
MTIRITMPQLGESVSEGVVGRWLKQEGERVERDEPLVEIMTDKVNAEIPAVATGVLQRITVQEGQTVAVGTEIAILEEADGASSVPLPPRRERSGESPPAPATTAPATPATADEHNGSVRTSPLVRRLAQEHGIDLAQVPGTGLNGRVTKEDILAFIGNKPAPAAAAQPKPVEQPKPQELTRAAPGSDQTVRVAPLRRMIAEHMVQSKSSVPHATTFVEVDMTPLMNRRAEVRAEFAKREGVDLTYLPFVIQAACEALRAFPTMNAEWADRNIILKGQVNAGFAVSVDDGLIVPVIRDALQYSIAGLARKVKELSDKARSGKLALDDVRGGTFTINNPGVFGTTLSVPIVNAPQAGILTMDAIIKRPVVVEGDAIAVRSMMFLGLAFDHRINDGLTGAKFLGFVRDHLQTKSASLI